MKPAFTELERWRFQGPPGERYGAWRIPRGRTMLCVIANDATSDQPWEHVSVHARDRGGMRCPTWDEMDYVKRLFWDDAECVMQLHVPREDWICNHAHVLHLWRPTDCVIPRPPGILVGIKELGVLK